MDVIDRDVLSGVGPAELAAPNAFYIKNEIDAIHAWHQPQILAPRL